MKFISNILHVSFFWVIFWLATFCEQKERFFLWGFISYLWYFAVFLQIKQTCGWIITFNCTLYLLEANTLLPFSLTKKGSNGFCGIFCCLRFCYWIFLRGYFWIIFEDFILFELFKMRLLIWRLSYGNNGFGRRELETLLRNLISFQSFDPKESF